MSPLMTELKIANVSGQAYWRGLEPLAADPLVQSYLEAEFPEVARQPASSLERRSFLRLMAASLTLAGVTLSGCRRWPVEEIRPHAARPGGTAPGVPQFYATSWELDGSATGMLVKSYDGRPIKIEGNPDHPDSFGATTALMQASILSVYDPERARRVRQRTFGSVTSTSAENSTAGSGEAEPDRTWADFDAFASSHFRALRDRQGAGLAFLTSATSSPTWQRLKSEAQVAFPQARWFQYQPLHHDGEFEGSRRAFGQILRPLFRFERARILVAFDADPLGAHPAQLAHARGWAEGRRQLTAGRMNRLYAIDPNLTVTGSVADRRLIARSQEIGKLLSYLAVRLGLEAGTLPDLDSGPRAFLDSLLRDLDAARGESILIAGATQPAEVHALVHAINDHLGNHGRTIEFIPEGRAGPTGDVAALKELAELLSGDAIRTLVILGGNPVYDGLAESPLRLSREVPDRITIHLTDYENETSAECNWVLPAAHFLECWGDGLAWDGTYSLQQPLIEPLLGGRSPIELLSGLLGQKTTGLALVRATFDRRFPGEGARGWEAALALGLKPGSSLPLIQTGPVPIGPPIGAIGPAAWELRMVPDFKVFDGRFANNAWLQELPDPLSKLTWDNAALISQADAERMGVSTGDKLRITAGDRELQIAALVAPGHAEGSITVAVGYGRMAGGLIGQGVGFDVYPLRASGTYCLPDVKVTAAGGRYPLATTQLHHVVPSVADFALNARLGAPGQPGLIVHECLLSDYLHDPQAAHGHGHAIHHAPLFDPPSEFNVPHKWGLTVDLNACLGCSGCVIACQAENNIPVVGKQNVSMNREMHWLRIDRYFKGPVADPDVVHLPMACAHCENAPCEQVCPVAATVHDSEGLNGMVYNRCIGTRYCANNCPYKVRRFNYFDYHASDPRVPAKPWFGIPDQQLSAEVSPLRQLLFNPEVSVRMRGVMEKCTYCVQRIAEARSRARNAVARGERETEIVGSQELQTACQAACPTRAICFGDLNDPQSSVSRNRADDRHYEILEELNLGARTTYLAKIRNR